MRKVFCPTHLAEVSGTYAAKGLAFALAPRTQLAYTSRVGDLKFSIKINE
jgi:hypothetical protein